MKKRVLVSIVAPVYNVEPYLPNFIDSVLGQTFSEWELLLIDDGSTDGSGRICDDYTHKDERIKVIHKTNGGVSSARNAGLKVMTGEWVLMPDPDDELPLDALESLYNNVSNEIDLISASYVLYKNGVFMDPIKPSIDTDLSRDEFVSLMGIFPRPRNYDRRCCNKLFRASIIKENVVFFPEDLHYREDILYNYLFLSNGVRKVRCISHNMYIYYRRDTGAAISNQTRYTPKSGDLFIAMTRCFDVLEQMGASNEAKDRMKKEVLDAYKTITKLIEQAGVGGKEKRAYFRKMRQYFSDRELLSIEIMGLLRRIKKIVKR